MRQSKRLRAMVMMVLSGVVLVGASRAECADKTETTSQKKSEKKRHPAIGAVVGTLAGLGAGLLVATQMECYDDCSGPIAVFFGGGVLGALGGYAVGGGFAGDTDQALDEGRARVREALAARAREPRDDTALACQRLIEYEAAQIARGFAIRGALGS